LSCSLPIKRILAPCLELVQNKRRQCRLRKDRPDIERVLSGDITANAGMVETARRAASIGYSPIWRPLRQCPLSSSG
jgi:hypothetical protein